MTYRHFKIEKKYYLDLSASDKKVLKILEEVVKDVDVVYQKQLKDGFYPKNVGKNELEKASRKNPEIFSPFTYVSNLDNQFIPIPYHELYAKYLIPITKKIRIAAKICENRSFQKYLLARAKSLLDGSYREADIAWLSVKNSKIDFSIGPFERYLDKTFLIKRVFQAHVGIINQRLTKLAEQFKETLYSSAKISDSKYHSTNIPRKGVNVLIEPTPAISGYAADVLFGGEHFPCDLYLALEHGSKSIFYQSQLKYKFDKLYYPIFKNIFEKRFASKYSKELLLEAAGWTNLLYELGKQLHKFEGGRERLKELYGPIDEANGFASGIEHSKHLVVKGIISQEQLEAIMISHILWMFADWVFYLKNLHKESHVIGNSILLNSYLLSGALKVSKGISWPNFSRIFFEIEALSYQLVNLLQKGTYKEAKEFVQKNADLKSFEVLGKSLRSIDVNI